MNAQPLSLFDTEDSWLPARKGEVTSRAAAQRINLRERKRQVMFAIADLSLGLSFTTDDVKSALRLRGVVMERGTVASRMSQLRRDGLIVEVGCATGPSGHWVTTFRLTDQGRSWLATERAS